MHAARPDCGPAPSGEAGRLIAPVTLLAERRIPPILVRLNHRWNRIKPRLLSFITQNSRGRPLTTEQVIVHLIAQTTTRAGLRVRVALDTHQYETGIEVSNEELARVRIVPARFHGEWNQAIRGHT